MADKKLEIKTYRLKIVFDKNSMEIYHLSESMDDEGDASLNVGGETIEIPKEMSEILNRLDDDTLGLS